MQNHTRYQINSNILSVLLTNTDMAFGDKLKIWRKAKGLTQKELAIAAGVKEAHISNLERNFSTSKTLNPKPSESLVERLAKVLSADLDEVRLAAGYAPLNNKATIKKPTNVMEFFEILESHGMEVQFDGGIKMLESLGEEDLQDLLDGIITNATLKAKRKNKKV